jgi:hypothetical protein
MRTPPLAGESIRTSGRIGDFPLNPHFSKAIGDSLSLYPEQVKEIPGDD